MEKKREPSSIEFGKNNEDLNELIECETYFGKDFFWNELETIVVDGVINSNETQN
jgi:hypothetical protein